MPVPKMKLYSTQSGYEAGKAKIEEKYGFSGVGHDAWCVEERVRSDHAEHANKYILPLHCDGPFKCDDLFSGEINWDNSLFPPPEDLDGD
tara:strand:+ start:878 stop:1147 length:270 start_codon:yes stop_codon:yes gene_type:complete